jgi:transcriptional regulator with XRE-family HTH domain
MAAASTPSRTLAAKLQHLFATVRPPGRGEYSNQEVATAIEGSGGPTISATYIWQLRKGLRTNPTLNHLEALASFFGVPVAYFLDADTTRRIDDELDVISALRDAGIRSVALRAAQLSPQGIDALRAMVEHVRRLEGLPSEAAPVPPARKPRKRTR